MVIRWTYDYDKQHRTSHPYTEYQLLKDNEVLFSRDINCPFKNISQFKKYCLKKFGLSKIQVKTIIQKHDFQASRI